MTPAELAALHRRCFTTPRPWSTEEFSALLETPGCFLLTCRGGFLLGRAIAGEAELLTLAVAPEARRQGYGRALAQEFTARARLMGASDLFLEVAADNLPAHELYSALGWRETGRRREYYGPGLDAIVMHLGFSEQQEGG
ncbi:GNAT family N-acetyltransferase [Paracoccus alkanivorans]|uniref:GNAT family N-acetyltransferase n=1 Tax=Paracoccus alkanivorans TaxID=2116655 RepID=A0A3M0MA77_9RHOB|nr:GNAT family N-acetyltransferase [Paracoccus alkanivorans]RMC34686.1 GNAT family N-acetyltransferase [Paracoccus alkanivorans]